MLDQSRTIDRDRVLDRLQQMSRMGALPNGGVCRLALSPEETHAKATLIEWALALGCTVYVDAIGNLFLRFDPNGNGEKPILVGSHLDTQPVGGNFDGVLGVIGALECLEVIARHSTAAIRPVEVAIWCNEEGARFNPTTMGSAVHAKRFPLADALCVTDAGGVSVFEALQDQLASLRKRGFDLRERELAADYAGYVELHIEQGPVLENEGIAIGIVTAVQGLAQFRLDVCGVAGHAGAVPMEGREDALTRAREVMAALDHALGKIPNLRFTIGRIDVAPGAINTIPARATFTLDVRHPDPMRLADATRIVASLCRSATLSQLIYQAPVPFNDDIIGHIEAASVRNGLSSRQIVSGATHDAAHVAALCPTGMIFVPCYKGISHNEHEYCAPQHVAEGTQVLVDTVLALAGRG